MKKTLFVAALAAVMVFAFASSALAIGPFYTSAAGNVPDYENYLSWTWVSNNANAGGEDAGTPHGNYTTTSNKCAVCHAVHRADPAGLVLTPITGGADNKLGSYTEGCGFCHGATSTFSTSKVNMAADFTISPHTNCNRCHIASPHGAGASQYAVLSARLINKNADPAIAADIASGNNGMDTVAMGDASDQTALTLGTGYLCSDCHSVLDSSDESMLAFAVNGYNDVPTASETMMSAGVTGHRVTAQVTTNWNQTGAYGAYYSGGGAVGAASQIAWAPANTCQACHDARDTAGNYAFPHGYVDAAGAYTTTAADNGALIWLTVDDTFDGTANAILNDGAGVDNDLLTQDGLCLKCHSNTAITEGVGINY